MSKPYPRAIWSKDYPDMSLEEFKASGMLRRVQMVWRTDSWMYELEDSCDE